MKFNCCVIIQLKKSNAVAYRIMNFVGWDIVTKKSLCRNRTLPSVLKSSQHVKKKHHNFACAVVIAIYLVQKIYNHH